MKTKKLKNCDSHIYLYAKGHYLKSDLWEDLRKIMSLRSMGTPDNKVTISDILLVLLSITYKYIDSKHRFLDFVNDLSPSNCWKVGYIFKNEKYSYEKALAYKCLSILRNLEVSRIENGLDKPNEDLLHLSKNAEEGDFKEVD